MFPVCSPLISPPSTTSHYNHRLFADVVSFCSARPVSPNTPNPHIQRAPAARSSALYLRRRAGMDVPVGRESKAAVQEIDWLVPVRTAEPAGLAEEGVETRRRRRGNGQMVEDIDEREATYHILMYSTGGWAEEGGRGSAASPYPPSRCARPLWAVTVVRAPQGRSPDGSSAGGRPAAAAIWRAAAAAAAT